MRTLGDYRLSSVSEPIAAAEADANRPAEESGGPDQA
jgi:hypothetical protein